MRKLLVALFICANLAACATPTSPTAMAVGDASAVRVEQGSPLIGGVGAPTVAGGRATNPMWTSQVADADFAAALRQSLTVTRLLASGAARYALKAELLQINQPIIGIDMTATARVRYTLTDAASGAALWTEEVTTPHTATMNDAFVGTQRLRLATEGAIRANITKMLQSLADQSRTNPALRPAVAPAAAAVASPTS